MALHRVVDASKNNDGMTLFGQLFLGLPVPDGTFLRFHAAYKHQPTQPPKRTWIRHTNSDLSPSICTRFGPCQHIYVRVGCLSSLTLAAVSLLHYSFGRLLDAHSKQPKNGALRGRGQQNEKRHANDIGRTGCRARGLGLVAVKHRPATTHCFHAGAVNYLKGAAASEQVLVPPISCRAVLINKTQSEGRRP